MSEKTEIYKLTYKIDISNSFQKCVRILGRKFFEKNKYIGRIIVNNKLKHLKDKIKLEDIKENELIIKIVFFQKINDKSYMFEDCSSLLSVFQKEKYYKKENSKYILYDKKYNDKYTCSIIFNLSGMFYNCKSLMSLPDISKWNTNNINNMSGMFCNCESLISLPDISKWKNDDAFDIFCMFLNCRVINFLSCMDDDINIEKISKKYILTYQIKSEDYIIKILDDEFVRNNEKEGIIIYNNQKYHLRSILLITQNIKDKLIIEIELSINVHDLSSMFKECDKLLEFKEYNEINKINYKKDNNDKNCFDYK